MSIGDFPNLLSPADGVHVPPGRRPIYSLVAIGRCLNPFVLLLLTPDPQFSSLSLPRPNKSPTLPLLSNGADSVNSAQSTRLLWQGWRLETPRFHLRPFEPQELAIRVACKPSIPPPPSFPFFLIVLTLSHLTDSPTKRPLHPPPHFSSPSSHHLRPLHPLPISDNLLTLRVSRMRLQPAQIQLHLLLRLRCRATRALGLPLLTWDRGDEEGAYTGRERRERGGSDEQGEV